MKNYFIPLSYPFINFLDQAQFLLYLSQFVQFILKKNTTCSRINVFLKKSIFKVSSPQALTKSIKLIKPMLAAAFTLFVYISK